LNVTTFDIEGLLLIEPKVFGDDRGFFLESYQETRYRAAGVLPTFIQDNHSLSGKGILRGLHLQLTKPQDKLVRVTEGEVLDVAVDLRPDSATFGKWAAVILSAQNFLQLYVPAGFAHGFFVRSERAQFEYKCSEYYYPEDEITLAWDDPDVGIDWQLKGVSPMLSKKDQSGQTLEEIRTLLRSIS
jgi:dTDP-4-dehydrorhamnose 3,5-epimerase